VTNTDPTAPQYEYDWQNPNLQSFDFGRVFSRTIDILRLRGLKMLFISALLIGLPIMLISMWPIFLDGGFQAIIDSEDSGAISDVFSSGVIAVIAIGGLLALLAGLWLQPALIKISYSAITKEDQPSLLILKQVSKFILPVLGFYILYFIAVILGFLLFVIPALFIGLGWMLGGHIIVLEGQGVFDSLGRSWSLTKGSKRWLLLLAIVFGVIGAIIGVVLAIPVYLIANPNIAMLEGASTGYWILNGIVSMLGQVVGTVLGVSWVTAAYVEIRKVREGVDPESQVDVFS